MADADLSWAARRGGLAAAPPLFERLPDRLFAPLSSPNRRSYWALLCRLHEKRFGPDAPLPPSIGFSSRDIVRDLEEELLTQDQWENEEGLAPETPIGIRANMVLGRLEEAGWLRREKYALERRVTMRPAVNQFLTMLIDFAHTGPVFVSAKIRSIDTSIQQILENKADGDTLSDAAEQARNLLVHVRNTGTTVRDIMESLTASESTAQYVRRFFSDYIERVFIGDYRELRTRDHPLSRRSQILRAVEGLTQSDQHRTRLIAWYENKRCPGDRQRAHLLFENDIHRLMELRRVDEYLDRLDDEIRRANRRALAVLDYQLRSLRPVELAVKHAIEAVASGSVPELADPFPAGAMVCPQGLAEPRRLVERPPPSTLRRWVPSLAELAKSRVMRRAREARTMTTPKLAQWVQSALGATAEVKSNQLDLTSREGVRAYHSLGAIGLAMASAGRRLRLFGLTMAKGFRVTLTSELDPPEQAVSGQRFVVQRREGSAHKLRENA
jgi:hypothetical protein